MTELQMGLIGIGVVAVIAVFAYNKWLEHTQRKAAEAMLRSRYADVLMAGGGSAAEDGGAAAEVSVPREEPVLADAAVVAEAEPEAVASPVAAIPDPVELQPEPALPLRADPAPVGREVEAVLPVVDLPVPLPAQLLSPLADCIAALDAVEPMPAERFLHSQGAALARLGKRVRWVGFDDVAREWRSVETGDRGAYRRLRVGLQLVDRRGPISDVDFNEFNASVRRLGEEFMAVAELPGRGATLDAARSLDRFCADVDIQIGLNVVAQSQPFPGTKIRALAEAAGMALAGDGSFVRCDDDGKVLFSLSSQGAVGFSAETIRGLATPGLTFLLDVPRVASGDRVFGQMLEFARRCADALHGVLVDDNRRPLSEPQLEPIRRQVAQVQATMGSHGIPAGGDLAQRLFS